MITFARTAAITLVFLMGATAPAWAQLSDAWIVPAAANTPGDGGTYWHTDLSIQNPQTWTLPLVVQVLESGQSNTSVPTLDLDVLPWETVNLWDVLGPDVFAIYGSYVQDWLLYDTDYNWRVLADQGGALRAVADIGTHWMDLSVHTSPVGHSFPRPYLSILL